VTAIAADDLRKAYGDTQALAGVSLSVDAGEVFALLGPNGAGKTTLVRCLTGTTTPDAGETRLLGSPPRSTPKGRIGLLPQDFTPPDRLTARELVAYYAGLYDDARDVDAVLEEVGITEAANARYADLSGGEKRRTLVATALVNDPEVLFLDEPTTGIDPAGRRAVHALIETLAAAGTTVFLTTHYMDEVERLADRVGVLADGELVAVDAPRALVRDHGGESRLLVDADATSVGRDANRPLDDHAGPLAGDDANLLAGDDTDSLADYDADSLADYDVEFTDRGLVLRNVTPGEIGGVIDALAAAGVEYDALSWREADLETAYLALTGEAPRSADTDPPDGRSSGKTPIDAAPPGGEGA
jgi:ABC-2 type transport system ATP-binding protein